MAVDRRMARRKWRVGNEKGNSPDVQHATLATLMDLRDTLDEINAKLGNLLTCAQLGNHLDRAIRKLRAPRRRKATR